MSCLFRWTLGTADGYGAIRRAGAQGRRSGGQLDPAIADADRDHGLQRHARPASAGCLPGHGAAAEEIAVIGVDNDDVLCSLSDPPLSSVVPDAERIGYQAALLLAEMMAGQGARAGNPGGTLRHRDASLHRSAGHGRPANCRRRLFYSGAMTPTVSSGPTPKPVKADARRFMR